MAPLADSEWSGILNRVKQTFPNLARHWFDDLQVPDLQHGVLHVRCANLPQQRYLGEHCARPFSEAAQQETGRLISVRFSVPDALRLPGSQSQDPPSFVSEAGSLPLNPEYTFDEFITGPCNRLAHAACVAVSAAPGQTYNPMFIHGSVGLGKTHLMHAICHHIKAQRQAPLKILYLSCETFTNHFIEAVERGALHQFRFRYRHVDILLIDDIQFLAARERSQEEFFHTFNTLYQTGKQIVLSADCSPRSIPSLEDRLVSRFNWGLVARIDRPCLETRIAILRKKARLRQVAFPEEVILLIASHFDSNTRELEGAITTVDAYSQQLGQPIDLAGARTALGLEPAPGTRQVTIPRILEVIAQHFGLKKSDLLGKRRTKSIALPRQICMHLSRELTGHSLEEIGSHFGGRDHTTVLHATRQVSKLKEHDEALSATLEHLKITIRNGHGERGG